MIGELRHFLSDECGYTDVKLTIVIMLVLAGLVLWHIIPAITDAIHRIANAIRRATPLP